MTWFDDFKDKYVGKFFRKYEAGKSKEHYMYYRVTEGGRAMHKYYEKTETLYKKATYIEMHHFRELEMVSDELAEELGLESIFEAIMAKDYLLDKRK